MMGEQTTAKYSINLFQADLLPQQPPFTLKRMVLVWSILLLTMLAWSQYSGHNKTKAEQQLASLQSEKKAKTAQLAKIEQALKNRKQDSLLAAKLATLKLVMRNKQALHARLTDPNQTYLAGFAQSMTELSKYHHKDISLQQVTINQNDMLFSGLAKTPEAVPQWLSGFEQSILLSGKHFKSFHLVENDNNVTEFTIGSSFQSQANKSAR